MSTPTNPQTGQPIGLPRQAGLGRLTLTLAVGSGLVSIILGLHRRHSDDKWYAWFLTLFFLKYLRLATQIAGYILYRPYPIPANPSYGPQDVTFVMPTIDPGNPGFKGCYDTVLRSGAAALFVATAGERNHERILDFVATHPRPEGCAAEVRVFKAGVVSKREQFACAAREVQTRIVATIDDSVVFRHRQFLAGLLAPFEDPAVGLVGTNKRVRRLPAGSWSARFWNLLGCLYLERHNFEIRASCWETPFVISGRLCAVRRCILTEKYLDGFAGERFFFGLCPQGQRGLVADDDNFLTRHVVANNWNIAWQDMNAVTRIETTIGTDSRRFRKQLLRWVKTTWRSNAASLVTDRTVWFRYPVATWSVFVWSFFNFSLLWDLGMVTTFALSSSRMLPVMAVACWITAAKLVKIGSYFCRHPQDLVMLPAYVLFA